MGREELIQTKLNHQRGRDQLEKQASRKVKKAEKGEKRGTPHVL
jgi:hypothetical protein